MKYLSFLCWAMLATTVLQAQSKTKKAVYIIIDGIAADAIEKPNPKHLGEIAKAGGYAHAMVGGEKNGYSQTPTISAVGYNSIMTGVWVNKHNVWDNDIAAPNYNYKNIFRLIKENAPGKTIGIFSSWLDNRTKLVGESLPEAGNINFDYHYDGLELDTVHYPHDKAKDYMRRIDSSVVDNAVAAIKTNAPDVSWVYLEYTDDMGHKYGDSPEYSKAINYADGYVGQLWDAIKYREKNFNEDWLIIVTTDHGRDAQTGKGHGGQSDRERAGWIYTNAQNLNERFKNNQASIVDIMPTIARFMEIPIPVETAREIDGVPLIGKLSLTDAAAQLANDNITITWKAQERTGDIKIWLTTTNNYKTGGEDAYKLISTSPVKNEKAVLNVKDISSTFYKIFLQGVDNNLNCWIILNKK